MGLFGSKYDDIIINCPSCGHRNKADSMFCIECGMKLQSVLGSFLCPKCNKINDLDNNFCTSCGEDFSDLNGRSLKILKNKAKVYLTRYYSTSQRSKIAIEYGYSCLKCNFVAMGTICNHCGNNLSLYCPNCGEIRNNDEKVCLKCGYEFVDCRNFSYCSHCINKQKPRRIPTCSICSEKLDKDLTNFEYQKIYKNEYLETLKNSFDINFDEDWFESFNLNFYQYKHIEAVIMRDLIFNNINQSEIISKFKELTENIISTEEKLPIIITDSLKEKFKKMFLEEGFVFLQSAGGTEERELVSLGRKETIKTPVQSNKHGTGSKILATAGLGLIGYAATSGIKTEYVNQTVDIPSEYRTNKIPLYTITTTVKEDSIEKITNEENKPPLKEVFLWEDVKDYKDDIFLLRNGNSIHFEIPYDLIYNETIYLLREFRGTYDDEINKKLFDLYHIDEVIEKLNQYVFELIDGCINYSDNQESKNSSNLDDLMKYADLYERGLLTKEEFEQKKKELL